MSQSFESDDIQLNTKRFNKKKKTLLVAELVSKYAEKRRAEYRINEMQGVFPESEIQAIKSKGPLDLPPLAIPFKSSKSGSRLIDFDG